MRPSSDLAGAAPRGERAPFLLIFVVSIALVGVAVLVDAVIWPTAAAHRTRHDPASVAYAFSGGDVVKLDARTGAIVARHPYGHPTMLPSLAVSRDGRAVFVLDTLWDGSSAHDRLTVLRADTLAPVGSAPADAYAQDGTALAVTPDDRTVAIYHEHRTAQASPDSWLTYVDRATATLLPVQTLLAGCGSGAQLLSLAELAVVCPIAGDVRLVDPGTQRVAATVAVDAVPGTDRSGRIVAAGTIPGAQALALVLDDGQLVRLDLPGRRMAPIADLGRDDGRSCPTGAPPSRGAVAPWSRCRRVPTTGRSATRPASSSSTSWQGGSSAASRSPACMACRSRQTARMRSSARSPTATLSL